MSTSVSIRTNCNCFITRKAWLGFELGFIAGEMTVMPGSHKSSFPFDHRTELPTAEMPGRCGQRSNSVQLRHFPVKTDRLPSQARDNTMKSNAEQLTVFSQHAHSHQGG
jgi:hypothetical protein